MACEHGNNDCREFTALALMYADSVGMDQFVQFLEIVTNRAPIDLDRYRWSIRSTSLI